MSWAERRAELVEIFGNLMRDEAYDGGLGALDDGEFAALCDGLAGKIVDIIEEEL